MGRPPRRWGSLINYGERFRTGERISTAFVESTVNTVIGKRFAKKQQMQWTRRGAHLLLQTRTRTLDGTLRAMFERWYPASPTIMGQHRACRRGLITPGILMLSEYTVARLKRDRPDLAERVALRATVAAQERHIDDLRAELGWRRWPGLLPWARRVLWGEGD